MDKKKTVCGNSIIIDFRLFLILPLLLLTIPVKYLLAVLASASIHEAAHIFATILLDGEFSSFCLTPFGAQIHVMHKSRRNAVLATLAGPLSGFLLLFFIRTIPLLSIFGGIQGAYNLLPFYPLDGGRILRTLRREKYSLHCRQ